MEDENAKAMKLIMVEYTPEEIADSIVYRERGTPEEEAQWSRELREAIRTHRKSQPLKKRIYWYFKAKYLSRKFRWQDFIAKWKKKLNNG